MASRFAFARAAGLSGRQKVAVATGLATGGLVMALERSVGASGLELHPPHLPWSHLGLFGQFDTFSIRRGWQVYKQVCAACHSLNIYSYFQFVNVFMTEKEAKAEAAEAQILDGPNEVGEMFLRPGRVGDHLPKPYPNAVAAAVANNGAAPPDLSVIALAREEGIDYIFWLLTSYQEPPAGIRLGPGQAYNPYFPGGVIGMARQLWDGGIEYDDGTPATTSQQAKDVCTFLMWTADPHHDIRKRTGFKLILLLGLFSATWFPWWRAASRHSHEERLAFRIIPGREPHVKTPFPTPNVLEAAPAAAADQLPLSTPVSGVDIARKTAHLYKSYAPVYDWKESKFWSAWRKFKWNHLDEYRLYGLLADDQKGDDNDPIIREAVLRLPAWEADARYRRCIRAAALSVHNEWLPREEWSRYEDETWYLQPYIDEVEAELLEQLKAEVIGSPNFVKRHILDDAIGKGKAMSPNWKW